MLALNAGYRDDTARHDPERSLLCVYVVRTTHWLECLPTIADLQMWLLDTWAIDLLWVSSATEERYAILSHVWDSQFGEDTFQVSTHTQLVNEFALCLSAEPSTGHPAYPQGDSPRHVPRRRT